MTLAKVKVAALGALIAVMGGVVAAQMQSLPATKPTGGRPLSARQLVDGYERSLAPFSQVTYAAESRVVPTLNGQRVSPRSMYGVDDDEQGRAVFRMLYRRDGNRLDVLSLKPGIEAGPNVWSRPELHLQRVIVDNSATILDYASVSDNARDAVISQRTPKGFAVADSVRMAAAGFLRGGEPLEGLFVNRPDKSIPEILRGAVDLRMWPEPENVDGHATYVLECTDARHVYRVYLDPDAGCNPRKLVERRLDPQGDGGNVVVDNIELEKVGERFVPVGAHTSWTIRSGPKYLFTWDAQYRRTDINFHPDFTGLLAFRMLVPPGTHARNDDAQEPSRAVDEWTFEDGRFVHRDGD